MATMEELLAGARVWLRDYPNYFEVDQGALNVLTIRLPHPMVSGSSLQVYVTDPVADPVTTTLTKAWSLDERNGLLKITDETALNKQVLISGYHYTWFSDSDLSFHITDVLHEMQYGTELTLANMADVQSDVVLLGGVTHALWSLALELSLDIDVSTPEGMFIPARQRHAQVMQMLQYFEGEYSSHAAMLNMGLNALTIGQLRRVAYTTGRYVPVYMTREVDDPRRPDRLWPPIPTTAPDDAPLWHDLQVTRWSTLDEGISLDGWDSIGTRGD